MLLIMGDIVKRLIVLLLFDYTDIFWAILIISITLNVIRK